MFRVAEVAAMTLAATTAMGTVVLASTRVAVASATKVVAERDESAAMEMTVDSAAAVMVEGSTPAQRGEPLATAVASSRADWATQGVQILPCLALKRTPMRVQTWM
jgi:hypothetical protein